MFQYLRPYDFQSTLEDSTNLGVGIALGGFLISIGFISRAAVIHAGKYAWWQEAIISTCLALAGTLLLMLARWLIVPLMLGRREYLDEIEKDNNAAACAAYAGVQIAIALLISSAVHRPWFG